MTLLITALAAVAATAIWYLNPNRKQYKLALPCFMYWGALLMWLVDAIFEFVELKEAYFTPEFADMINDAFLGFAVVALGLIVWVIVLVISDPKGVIRKRKEN